MSGAWWKQGVIYQIYPRSFQDGNGDGVGDLQGIIERLDYVRDLGAAAIWISPICPSPMADFGYDVSDYTDIDPLFGDLATFDRLIAAAHDRDLKVILDYVPNHSSDQHPWFIESRSSRDNPKSDWYIWRDAKPDGSLPNNWLSCFGGPAWEWDETRRQYYLHSFLKEQPDLDWQNPAVKQAMLDVIRFWMARGVDGLRMDVIFYLLKHPDLLDNPQAKPSDDPHKPIGEYDQQQHIYDMNWPDGRQALLTEIRRTLDEFPDRVGVGETYLMNPADITPFYGDNLDGLHVPFNFTLLHVPWQAAAFHKAINRYYGALPQGAWPNFVLGSHDEHRLATRYGPENARAAALLLFTLRGTPTWYYGDEIGMQDVPIPPGKEQDPWGLRVPEMNVGRDPARTPMRWDDSPNAGFAPSGVETWLPVGDDAAVNVAAQDHDPASHLNFVRNLLRLRRDLDVLHGDGYFAFVDELPEDVLAYMRAHNSDRVLIVINMGAQKQTLDLSTFAASGRLLISTASERAGAVTLASLVLRPHEGVLIALA